MYKYSLLFGWLLGKTIEVPSGSWNIPNLSNGHCSVRNVSEYMDLIQFNPFYLGLFARGSSSQIRIDIRITKREKGRNVETHI